MTLTLTSWTSRCSPRFWRRTTSSRLHTIADLEARLAEVRSLSEECHTGKSSSFNAFRELVQLLLSQTVIVQGQRIRLVTGPDESSRNIDDTLRLSDDAFLRVRYSLFIDVARQKGPILKTLQSSFQYQLDEAGRDWVFRYDYMLKQPSNPHPRAHLQLHGLLHADVALPRQHLKHVHFPAGRPTLEGLIRCLVEQFGIETNTDPSHWRPLLAQTEGRFLEIAYQPTSGPDL